MAAVAAVAAAAALRMPHMPLLSLPSLPSLPSGMPPASWSIGAPADLNPTLTARLAAASPGGVADLSVFSTVPVLAHLTGCSPQLGASPVASLPWASAGVGTAQGWAAAARAPAANAISVISAVPLFVPLPSDAATAAQADDEDDVVDVTEGHIAVVAAASLALWPRNPPPPPSSGPTELSGPRLCATPSEANDSLGVMFASLAHIRPRYLGWKCVVSAPQSFLPPEYGSGPRCGRERPAFSACEMWRLPRPFDEIESRAANTISNRTNTATSFWGQLAPVQSGTGVNRRRVS
eukprot:scaffold6054_cov54-Phaeocystis_antarctica.AAC.5